MVVLYETEQRKGERKKELKEYVWTSGGGGDEGDDEGVMKVDSTKR